jgi:hypothetical protein
MGLVRQIAHSNFFIKLKSWEYWPFGFVQFPVFFYFAWLCIRARSLTFFAASNPGIPMGGMFGESKYDILKKIPPTVTPVSLLVETPTSVQHIVMTIQQSGLNFPLIFKPELGERGFKVARINSVKDIETFLMGMSYNFLIQEFVDEPLEFGIFYRRYPGNATGEVTSVVLKEMLSVTGDGVSTLQQLILNKDRAKLHWKTLRLKFRERLNEVIGVGIAIELVSIGNHCLGTKFINRNDLINDVLNQRFDEISKQIDGFYFGRYDLRCSTLADLYAGKVKIMELNGCGAEPAHIYDPRFSFFRATVVLLKHWRTIFEIARENNRRGTRYISFAEALRYYRIFKQRVA